MYQEKLFELVFIGGKGLILRVKGRLAVKGKHGQHQIGLHHGVKQHFHICCYVDLSTGFQGLLESDALQCFSLVFLIGCFYMIHACFLRVFLV